MSDWKTIKIEGVSRIERVAGQCYVSVIPQIPASVLVIVVEEGSGVYCGMTNMAVKDSSTGKPLWVQGRGETVKITLEQTIRLLIESTRGLELSQEEVVWRNLRDI